MYISRSEDHSGEELERTFQEAVTWLQQQSEKALPPTSAPPEVLDGKRKGICWVRQVLLGSCEAVRSQEKCWKAQCQVKGCNRQLKVKVKELSEESRRKALPLNFSAELIPMGQGRFAAVL